MAAFGDRNAKDVTTKEVSNFLRSLDRAGLTPRNVNKHRQILSAMFAYGCRGDSFDLPRNPVDGTDKRRENPPPALDYYEIEEVEALARCCERGEHRTPRSGCVEPAEAAARQTEDRQDADAFRLLFYTGVRLGEVLTLRWDDVNLGDRLLLVRRGLSAGRGDPPQGTPPSLRAPLLPRCIGARPSSRPRRLPSPRRLRARQPPRSPPRSVSVATAIQARMCRRRPSAGPPARATTRRRQLGRQDIGRGLRPRLSWALKARNHGSLLEREAPPRGARAAGSRLHIRVRASIRRRRRRRISLVRASPGICALSRRRSRVRVPVASTPVASALPYPPIPFVPLCQRGLIPRSRKRPRKHRCLLCCRPGVAVPARGHQRATTHRLLDRD